MQLLADLGLGQRTLVMGILNVTPDSFSDGGAYLEPETAIARGLQLIEEGADIVDVGGESTRPATFQDRSPLSVDEELQRVVPVIRGLRDAHPGAVISIDTYKSRVASAATEAGARIINDISGLAYDPEMASVVSATGAGYVLMHMLGSPRSIPLSPVYADVISEISTYFQRQIELACSRHIFPENIILDPGIGFGKTAAHNFEILRRFRELTRLGYPLLSGPSRKNFLGKAIGGAAPAERVEATAAAVALSIAGGADIVRVHDVAAMVKVAKVSDAVTRGWREGC